MILSSADILRILGGSEIIRLSAKIKVVDGKPALSGAEGLFISIERFPRLDEFEATWTLYVESDGSEPDDLVLAEIRTLLPSVAISEGLLTTVTTTDFLSESTQRAPEAPKTVAQQIASNEYEERFQELIEDVQDQMLLVTSGRPGANGIDGKDGRDGRDGRDLDATDTELFDLKDVNRGIPLHRGQVLMWDGKDWTNLFVPQISSIISGGGSGGDGEGVIISDTAPDTREDGSPLESGDQWWDSSTGVMYVWYVDGDSGQWVQSSGGDGGGPSTLAGLLDTDTSGVVDGEILVYRSATGDWTAEPAPATGLQPGDNISELTNDVGYITLNEVPASGIEEAPQDGNYYVRQDGQWISLSAALFALNDKIIDGGNLTTGSSQGDDDTIDGGGFS